MKNTNTFLMVTHIILGIIIIAVFFDEMFFELLPSANHAAEVLIFWVVIPFYFLTGVFAYPLSYRAIKIKLILPALVSLFMWALIPFGYYKGSMEQWGIFFAAVPTAITVAYGIALYVIVSVTKYFVEDAPQN